jgi:flagellin
MRANTGAFVNRLEHAVNNLLVSQTNQQAAESLIRDVDFAEETSDFTKNQILSQSAAAMLSQANAIPQSVLTLLE